MAIIHSLSSGFKNQVSGVGCQVSGERNVRAETRTLGPDTVNSLPADRKPKKTLEQQTKLLLP
jgi:hypothetical protein